MADKESQIVVSFVEGVTEGVAVEVAEGVVTRSEETRLSKLKGTVSRRPKETVMASVFGAPPCGGMAMGVRESAVAYFKPKHDQRRIVGTHVESVIAPSLGTSGANAYWPYPLSEAGVIGGGRTDVAPATCFDSVGRQWFAHFSRTGGVVQSSLYVSVVEDEHELVTPRVIYSFAGWMGWVGLTPCTGGVVVWYQDTAGISCRKLTIVSDALNVGASNAIYAPLVIGTSVTADVTGDGANRAWLVCRDNTVNTTVALREYNLTTFASASTASLPLLVTGAPEQPNFGVTYFMTGAGTEHVAVATSAVSGSCYRAVRPALAISGVTWATTTADGYGKVSALPLEYFGRDSVVFALAIASLFAPVTGQTFTSFDERVRTTGVSLGVATVPWYLLHAKGAAHRADAGETYPYFPLVPVWLAGSAVGTDTYMDTPQIVVVTPYVANGFDPITQMTPVMRCAVDRVAAPATFLGFNSSSSALGAAGQLGITYLVDRLDQPPTLFEGQDARYCVFDLASSGQPGVAADVGPVAAIASGLVAAWDGQETTEYGLFTRPLIVVDVGGSGPALTGTYSYTAVISWRDAAGNVRRSAPALPVLVVLAAEKPIIYVTIPLTMRNGVRQDRFDVTLYATVAGGSIYYVITAGALTKGVSGCWRYTQIFDTVLGTLQLYSLGGPGETLLPECPPPAWDVRSIAGRLWLIDAENRNRVLPSLLKQQGIAIEFNASLEIVGFDQQYGKLMAVVDVGGSPFVLAERGAWRVDGYGPDNAGLSGGFTDPQLAFNVGCRSRASVAQVPGVGVLFQCNDGRFALLAGGLERFETFGVYDVGSPTVHLLQNEVIYPLTDGSGFIVFNWLVKGWTKWPSTVARVLPSTTTLQTDARSRTYYYGSDGSLLTLDSDSIDSVTTQHVLVERGWVAPAGPQGDCVIREFWVHVIYNAAHSIKIRASFDYDTTSFVEQTWTNLELVPLLQDGRYTVGLNCAATPARAVRVLLEFTPDVAGETGQPLTLTVPYAASVGIRRRTLPDGAIK